VPFYGIYVAQLRTTRESKPRRLDDVYCSQFLNPSSADCREHLRTVAMLTNCCLTEHHPVFLRHRHPGSCPCQRVYAGPRRLLLRPLTCSWPGIIFSSTSHDSSQRVTLSRRAQSPGALAAHLQSRLHAPWCTLNARVSSRAKTSKRVN
jgi:hypothetical protein